MRPPSPSRRSRRSASADQTDRHGAAPAARRPPSTPRRRAPHRPRCPRRPPPRRRRRSPSDDPVTTITVPEAGASVRTPLTIRGEAAGVDRIGRVTITVKDTGTNTVLEPGDRRVAGRVALVRRRVGVDHLPVHHLVVPPSTPRAPTPTGLYQATAFAWDGQGHKDPTGSRVRFVGTEPVADGEWDLVWSDEFDGTTLDPHRWKTFTGDYGTPYRDQYYTDPTRERPGRGRPPDPRGPRRATTATRATPRAWSSPTTSTGPRSGASRGNLSWTYGRFEVRARIPDVAGMWPAFWMRPADQPPTAPGPDRARSTSWSTPGRHPRGSPIPEAGSWWPTCTPGIPMADSGTSGGPGGSHQHEGVWWVDEPRLLRRVPHLGRRMGGGPLPLVRRRSTLPRGRPRTGRRRAPASRPRSTSPSSSRSTSRSAAGPGRSTAGTLPARFEIDHVRVYR